MQVTEEKIEALAALGRAINLADLIAERNGAVITFQGSNGCAPSANTILWKVGQVSVADGEILQGQALPEHQHEEWQMVVVYSGRLECHSGDSIITIGPAGYHVASPHTAHRFVALEDTRVVLICIPSDDAFKPEGTDAGSK